MKFISRANWQNLKQIHLSQYIKMKMKTIQEMKESDILDNLALKNYKVSHSLSNLELKKK